MKTETATTETATSNLSALPDPLPQEELLRQLNEARSDLAMAEEQKKIVLKQRDDLKERLDDLEKNSFLFTLNHLDPAVLDDLNEKMCEVSKAVNELGESGTLNLSLKVKRMKESSALVVMPEVKAKKPEPEISAAIFYATEDGHLQRNDPRQREFGFAERK